MEQTLQSVMTPTENLEIIGREELYQIRIKKIKDHITAARNVLAQHIEPLEVADSFISSSFQLMKEGISRRFPKLSPKELNEKVQQHLSINQKIHTKRKRRRDHG
ncbi:MAG: hypothetical protein BAJALOKI1v1_1410009 [Promethearchaeota archaeon]|nr:MAG: hypothetical protein BAJALOKI1v1_1410009 [Candidatus Lokiarchaeota archaeon]